MASPKRCPRCAVIHSPNCKAPRWPLQPLLDVIPPGGVERTLGVSGGTLTAALRDGLTDTVADRWAVKAGFHPAQVWPDWVDGGLSVLDRAFLASGWRQAWLHDEAEAEPVEREQAA